MDNKEFALQEHEKWAGKIEVISRAKLDYASYRAHQPGAVVTSPSTYQPTP